MPYLTLYRFTTDFTINDSYNINAILATEFFQSCSPIFMTMGFDGEEDYIKSYPSGFLRKSEYGKLLNADVDDSFVYPCIQDELMCVNLMDYRYDPQEVDNLNEFLEAITNNIIHGFVFMFPTMSEMLECEGLENISEKKLSFCMDWDSYGS